MRKARRKVVLPALGLEEIKKLVRAHALILMDKYGIRVVGVFGSYTRVRQRARAISTCWRRSTAP